MEGISRRRQHRRDAIASRRRVVERAEAYVRTHGDARVSLSTLCRIVGLSERGLRNAFYSVRGMSPKRCLLAARLEGVRRALSEAGTRPTTVTGVATDHGFYELGRFAATYREAFGEAPSETLRAAGRKSVLEQSSGTKGQADVCTS
jgi:transcriptional regulator GlxA family with amidase domain